MGYYEETVYFFPLSSHEFVVLIWSISEGCKAESALAESTGGISK